LGTSLGFDLGKYQLIHLTRTPRRYSLNARIELSTSVRYLEIMMDQPLRWWPRIQHIQGKARATIQALRSLAGPTWGSALMTLRQVYLAMVIPQITCGCSTSYMLLSEKGHTTKMCVKLNRNGISSLLTSTRTITKKACRSGHNWKELSTSRWNCL